MCLITLTFFVLPLRKLAEAQSQHNPEPNVPLSAIMLPQSVHDTKLRGEPLGAAIARAVRE
jgi:hypothetical protein